MALPRFLKSSCATWVLRLAGSVAIVGWLTGSGCASKSTYFRVTSYPEGATVYVDGESRGQTHFDRLEVDFGSGDEQVILRVEKQGYQPTGVVLSSTSPREISLWASARVAVSPTTRMPRPRSSGRAGFGGSAWTTFSLQ